MKSFKQHLNESSLSRVWSKIEEHQCGAISGYRDENSTSQNRKNNSEISAYLRKKGYSVTRVSGNYVENFGTDTAKEVAEPSFFVCDQNDSGNLEKDLMKLGQMYDQDSVLIIPQGGKGAYLYGTSKRDNAFPEFMKKFKVGDSKFGKATGEFFSRIGGRQFAFEEKLTRHGKWSDNKLSEEVEERMKSI